MSLVVGDQIPDFKLSDHLGNKRTSSQAKGRPLVLFFYPKDDTPGCTAEACGFRDKYDLFQIFGARVWGVSNDDELSHLKFAEKNNLPFPLLCDANNFLRKVFGVPRFLGLIDGRVTYIIDSKGIIRHVFNDLINGPQHVTEALRILEEIKIK
tara:strand:+ start:605 stop:1063 length:459 start_codon:yes stop_codon:yes gene_type:complete